MPSANPQQDSNLSLSPAVSTARQRAVWIQAYSFLQRWRAAGLSARRVDLTSAPDSPPADALATHFHQFRRDLEDSDGQLHWYWVQTHEGPHGVIQAVLAGDGLDLNERRVRDRWRRLHGAERVYVCRVGRSEDNSKRIAGYLAGHQHRELVHRGGSFGRSFGGSLERAWSAAHFHIPDESARLDSWRQLLGGDALDVDGRRGRLVIEPPPELAVTVDDRGIDSVRRGGGGLGGASIRGQRNR